MSAKYLIGQAKVTNVLTNSNYKILKIAFITKYQRYRQSNDLILSMVRK